MQTNPNIQPQYDRNSEPMKLGDWLVTFLLLVIPIANLVLPFVWAFGSDVNKSKKTFFQCYLILMAVSLVLSIIMWSALISMLSQLAY
jgi:hypothetical protein